MIRTEIRQKIINIVVNETYFYLEKVFCKTSNTTPKGPFALDDNDTRLLCHQEWVVL